MENKTLKERNSLSPCTTESAISTEENLLIEEEWDQNDEEELAKMSVAVLNGNEGIPLRLKILLDKLVSVLSPEKMVTILFRSKWTKEEFTRGYKEKMTVDGSNTWKTVDEQEHLDIIVEFAQQSEWIQRKFPGGIKAPLFDINVEVIVESADVPLPKSDQMETVANVEVDKSPEVGSNAKVKFRIVRPEEQKEDQVTEQDKRHICDDCGYSFLKKSYLRIHIAAVHLKTKRFTCTVNGCNKKFYSKYNRDVHSRRPRACHSNEECVVFCEKQRQHPFVAAERVIPKPPRLYRHPSPHIVAERIIPGPPRPPRQPTPPPTVVAVPIRRPNIAFPSVAPSSGLLPSITTFSKQNASFAYPNASSASYFRPNTEFQMADRPLTQPRLNVSVPPSVVPPEPRPIIKSSPPSTPISVKKEISEDEKEDEKPNIEILEEKIKEAGKQKAVVKKENQESADSSPSMALPVTNNTMSWSSYAPSFYTTYMFNQSQYGHQMPLFEQWSLPNQNGQNQHQSR